LKNKWTEYHCPACGFLHDYKPWDGESASFNICACCGIQFGYTDAAGGNINERKNKYISWRKNWIENGMKWSSIGIKQPVNWNPFDQLKVFE
jgi:hypothetical protein